MGHKVACLCHKMPSASAQKTELEASSHVGCLGREAELQCSEDTGDSCSSGSAQHGNLGPRAPGAAAQGCKDQRPRARARQRLDRLSRPSLRGTADFCWGVGGARRGGTLTGESEKSQPLSNLHEPPSAILCFPWESGAFTGRAQGGVEGAPLPFVCVKGLCCPRAGCPPAPAGGLILGGTRVPLNHLECHSEIVPLGHAH